MYSIYSCRIAANLFPHFRGLNNAYSFLAYTLQPVAYYPILRTDYCGLTTAEGLAFGNPNPRLSC